MITSKIIGQFFEKGSKLLPVKKIFENDKVIAFHHPKPFWGKHIIIIPKKAIPSLEKAVTEDQTYLNACLKASKTIIKKEKLEKDFTLVTNGGKRQKIKQVHFHLGSGNKRV